jgi:hypothetical protein
MTHEFCDIVNRTIQEYDSVFPPPKKQFTPERHIDWTQVEAKLRHEMEWTQEGANHVAALARDYGGFMLRNALALATTLGVEDGLLGF